MNYDAAKLTEPLSCLKCGYENEPTVKYCSREYIGNGNYTSERIELGCRRCGAVQMMRPADDPVVRYAQPEPPWTLMQKVKLWAGIGGFLGIVSAVIWATS